MNHGQMQFLATEFPYKKQYANYVGVSGCRRWWRQ
jgi:hypothetical protein